MYNHHNAVSDFIHQPQEAFLFLPFSSKNEKVRDDFKIGEGAKIRRLIFQGWADVTYTTYELQQLEEFEQYLKAEKITLDPRWNRAWKLKYLLSTGCNQKKCVEDMKIFLGYIENVRELHFTRIVSKLLTEGVFYIGGKDCHYRPIIVYNSQKLVNLKCSGDEMLEAQIYLLQYVIKHYLIPGQVQNWIALIDSAQQGFFSMIDTMKKAFIFLADTYRSRLFACYNVRISMSVSIIWKMIKNFFEPQTLEKISLYDENVPQPLFEYCSPTQIEVKFGGTMPNIEEGHFWPPREWSRNYQCQKHPVKLLTPEQYTQLYQAGTLHDTKIHEENIAKPISSEMRENLPYQILKKIEREFRVQLESCNEDRLNFEKDIEPYSNVHPPLSFSLLKSIEMKSDI